MTVDALRANPDLRWLVKSVVTEDFDHLAMVVRNRDIGTTRSLAFIDELKRLGEKHLGPDYQMQVIGQWVLAQNGMALGIAVDDTIHLVCRLRQEHDRNPEGATHRTLAGTGRALMVSTIILGIGFASMATSQLLALRHMGIVAALTLVVALLTDLFGAGALFAWDERRQVGRRDKTP